MATACRSVKLQKQGIVKKSVRKEALSCKSNERPRIAIVSFRAEKAKLSNVLFGRRTAIIGIAEEQCCIAVHKKRVEMRRQGSV